jgi:5-methyltetrahydropteroyltriglutamate--homocysteine methyltransferase
MVEFFGQNLGGFAFTANGWVQSYGSRCVKPPIIVSDITRTKPLTVELAVYAQSLSKKPVKGMLTGPVTILNWSFPREDIPLRTSAFQLALAIRDEVLDLEENGIGIIQIDEAALREKMPLRHADRKTEYLDWAIPAFALAHSGVRAETQIHTHMCYSDFTEIVREIDAMDADVITFEAARSNLEILDYLVQEDFQTAVGPGLYDIHSPRVPSEEEIESSIRTILRKTGKDGRSYQGLWVNPDCGLKTRTSTEAEASLRHLVAAAKKVRASYPV